MMVRRGPVVGLVRRGAALAVAGLIAGATAGCGGARHTGHPQPGARPRQTVPSLVTATARPGGPRTESRRASPAASLVALVTAPTDDRLWDVTLPAGRVIGSISVAGAPVYAAAAGPGGPVIVVSARSGAVTILSGPSLHRVRELGGFTAPHIPALVPGGDYAYVTDDGSGRLTAIRLTDLRIVSRTFVGAGAHHLAISPDASRVWVALGQSARTIVILATLTAPPPGVTGGRWTDPGHPHVLTRFSPGYRVHDLQFTPDGRRVWLTSASGSQIGVFDTRDHRLRFRVPAGPPPQHVVFAGRFAYVTSGYGARIEQVRWATGQVVRRVWAPYGSFELDVSGRYVVTSSLFAGTLAVYDLNLHRFRVRHLASSAEDVAVFAP